MSNIGKMTIGHSPLSTTRHRSPILRVQKKKAIKKQNSVKNFDSNYFHNSIENGNHLINNNLQKKQNDLIKKNNSTISYKNFCLKSLKSPNNQNALKKSNNNSKILVSKNNLLDIPLNNKINKLNEKQKHLSNIRTQSLPNVGTVNKNLVKFKLENDYYCLNCYNTKLMIKGNKLKDPFKNENQSEDANYYHKTLELKNLDEDYINNKVIQNQKKQLKAFNYLKNKKDKKSRKENLQYINENEDNPFIGFDLQDYLYYKNKNKNEMLNKAMINNINLYEIQTPRRAIKDYYKNVQFQIPLLEKQFGPSDKYKKNYIETLKKQIFDKEKKKKDLKKMKLKRERDENKKYNEYINKLKIDEKAKKALKQTIFCESNKNLEEFLKKKNEIKNNENLNGTKEKMKKINRNQDIYKKFMDQQRINEKNCLQHWLNENMRQKQIKNNEENNESQKWKNYNNKYIKSFNDNTYTEKCANCNAAYPYTKLYKFPENNIS